MRLNHINEGLQQSPTAADRYFELLDTEPEIQDAPDAVELEDVKGRITLTMSPLTMMRPQC